MTISKFHNQQYSGNVPLRVGDRYFSQDRILDFRYLQDRMGIIYEDVIGQLPILLSGGVVTQGAGLSLDITAGYGYAKHSVEIPNSFASTPPTKSSADIEGLRITWGTQNDINAASSNCSVYTVVDDGATVQYVKMRFLETDGNTRTRAKAAGSYAYEVEPDFDLQVDDVAPTDYDILLATFTSAGGVYTITASTTHVLNYPTIEDINDWIESNVNEVTNTSAGTYTITDSQLVGYTKLRIYANPVTGAQTYTLPTLADNLKKEVEIIVTDLGGKVVLDGEGGETIGGYTDLGLQSKNDHILVVAEAGEWQIKSYHAKYDTGWINTNDWSNRETGSSAFDYDNKSTSFIIGEVITEATSGNTGIIQSDDGTTIYVKNVTGTGIWTNDREITGSTSGCTADVDEGAGSNKNQDTDVFHEFGITSNNITILSPWVSTDGTEANSYIFKPSDTGTGGQCGTTLLAVDSDFCTFRGGTSGTYITNASGASQNHDTEDYYYRVILEVII